MTSLLFLVLFSMEMLLRFYLYPGFFVPLILVYIALFTLLYAVVLRLLTGLFSPRANYALAWFFLLILGVLFAGQYIYFLFFKTPFVAYSVLQAGQVAEFSGETLQMVLRHLPQTLSFFAPPLLLLIFSRKRFKRLGWKRFFLLLLFGVALFFAACYSLAWSGHAPASPYNTYYNENSPPQSQEKLGVLTGLRLDIERTLFGFSPKDGIAAVTIPEADPETEAEEEAVAEEETLYDPNVLDIGFQDLIAQETDPELLAMHRYFSSLTPTRKNAYTGMFADYNLIMITAESFSYYLTQNETLFPTIHRLATEGFTFTNMYTPIWNVSTSDGEYVAMTGLLPKSGVWSFSRSADCDMPFALGAQFSGIGYPQPLAYHNHTYDYYDRNLSHPNMGYDYRALGHGLEVARTWPESDVEMMEKTIPEYLGTSPFHVYYMTVSGHLEYNFYGNAMASAHRDEVADQPYSDQAKAYLACNLELENALSYLLSELEAAGQLERTVIVISADHYPYGLEDSAMDELAGHKVESNFERYRNGLIIWQADVEHQVIDTPVCSADILPTVSNLFGLPYDSRLLMGRDIFADNGLPLVIFNNRSWITDKASYNAVTGEVIGKVSEDYVNAIHQLVNARLTYSAKILETDYYRIVLSP